MTIFEGMEQLKQEHPVIAEALELFGVTVKAYQEALEAMQPKLIYNSVSTTATVPITYTSNSTRQVRWNLA
ncbi:MAG TPA: hypothetical protein VFA10_14315 [Ktedonobacteraceae bacterium]|nr:hypothetical protein [Ktedonobacteraceae bacterium]